MKLSWVKALGGFCLAALLSAPAFGANPALPGTLNFVEGQASIQNQPVTSKSVGTADLEAGQTITTAPDGRAEVLLTPGVFLRLDHDSAVKMISPDLTNTEVAVVKGRAEVEVDQLFKQNNIQVLEDDATARLVKPGIYDFAADQDQVRVFKGEAQVIDGDKKIKLGEGHELTLNAPKVKSVGFDKKSDENDFYNWGSLRSEYLSDASANAAQMYIGGNGWIGPGWYWAPGFYDYTFIPGAGLLYSPFGPWGFYSPAFMYSYGPYLGFYGGPVYGRGPYGYGFRPGLGFRYNHPAPVRGFAHVGGFRGERGFAAPAFRGGGFAGGGFHGGGGGFRR